MQKRMNDSQFDEVHRNIDLCNNLFPLAFPKRISEVKPRPLKIGINQDLVAALRAAGHEISMCATRRMMAYWCSRSFYLNAFKSAEQRIDLQGQPVAAVTAEEKEIAKKQLLEREARKAIKAERHTDAIAEVAENVIAA
jgi:ProP effector